MKKIYFILISSFIIFNLLSCGPNKQQVIEQKEKNAQDLIRKQDSIKKAELNKPDIIGKIKDANITNAYPYILVFYPDDKSLIIIPDKTTDFKYLNHNFIGALSFALLSDDNKIKSLSINNLKENFIRLLLQYKLPFNSIIGCEDIAKSIDKYDEFGLNEHKQEIINTILQAHQNYYNDFINQYLKNTYTFPYEEFKYSNVNNNIRWDGEKSYYKLEKEDFNFDNKTLHIGIFRNDPKSKIWNGSWPDAYLYYKYGKESYDILHKDDLNIPLSIDIAKQLLGDNNQTFCETLYTIKPNNQVQNSYAPNQLWGLIPCFDLLYITKNFYNQTSWSAKENKFVGEPIISIRLFPNENHKF